VPQKAEKGLKGLLPQIATTEPQAVPRPRVEGTKQDAFGLVPRKGPHRLFSPQGPRPAPHWEQAQAGLIVKEPHGLRRQALQLPPTGPFFWARCGCFSE
jgi:hypothetical protein